MSKSIKLKDNIFFNGEICDMGSNADGSYVKWANGLMIVYKTKSGTVDITNSTMGGTLYYGLVSLGYSPHGFIERPTIICSLNNQSGTQCFLVGQSGGDYGDQNWLGTQGLGRTSSRAGLAYVLDIFAIGRWK